MKERDDDSQRLSHGTPRLFSYEELKSFTSNLKKNVGFGEFGDVYKGKFSNGVKIAVKVLKKNTKDVMIKQFMAEVSTMGSIYHPNLIKLYGYCFDIDMKALVYEYMKFGSLDKILFKNHIDIEWGKLYNIAVAIADGLSFLHECRPRIIHYDIKPDNVLIDSNYSPKIIDFGMARHSSQAEQSGYRGTNSYAAPEVGKGRLVTYKSDVYSFGMMMFEILRKKRNSVGPGWFPGEVALKVENDELDEIILVCGIDEENKEKAEKLSLVALWCTQEKHSERPDMSSVVKMLNGDMTLEKPPNPFGFYDNSPESSVADHRPLPKFSPAVTEGSRERAADLAKITSVHSGSSSTSRPPSKIIPNNDLKREIRPGQNASLQKEQIKQYFSPQSILIGGSTKIDGRGALSHFSPALTEVRSFGNEACSESDFRGDMADALSLIPASVLRNLADKLYEKRKNAALEIEGIVKQLAVAGDHDRITAVINLLTTEFTYSPQANHRKGGLIGLGAATVGLTMEAAQHLEQIVPPVLNSFSDQDSRVRYYACEALYNIAKTVRGDFIVFFNQISDALCKLSADSDANVQSAAHLLDRLVKDIVTESDQFSPYEENDQESKTIPANMEFNSSSTFKPLLKSNPVDPRRSGFNIDSQKERRLQVRDASGSTFVDQTGNTSIEKVAYTWEMLLETFPKKCPPGGKNSVVLYTSLDVMGDTNRVRSTFQNLQINYSLRDVINPAYEEELRNLLGELAELPALFVQGRYIGGTNAVQKLNKEGKLKILFGGIPKY